MIEEVSFFSFVVCTCCKIKKKYSLTFAIGDGNHVYGDNFAIAYYKMKQDEKVILYFGTLQLMLLRAKRLIKLL